ncbi:MULTISPECIES: iron chelate uptake ABC transporter family permease subunit [unclassified Paenibacillus]|uniref:iron chelate uptake ABC transporter family permease subunit n=1 Tax=unclassified Paenibacillus TaxID=185978 RepID=UPI001C11688B|nr:MULTISPECIES: iron chelate uptake ABC transporter family permease subunit [unclassified Paenibacillus]MBU5441300.1 iron chelate uptake ABC transporter family permease subunit [Paenibacillus sp. MSJ-34]CAH0120866.1 Petrobactin import system permease protein YclO [Paenibacillus sp. CECT 9249]
MSHKTKLYILAAAALLLIVVFLSIDAGGNWSYVLERRTKKILAILLTGGSIAFSTVVFQTVTNNKILTPSIIGLDSLYMLIQTFIVFFFGSTALTMMSKNVHFLISVGLMIFFAGLLYKFLFKREGRNIYFLLLVGLIFGTFFSSISSFMQMIIDPNEFLVIQDKMFASFNNVNTDILILAFIIVFATAAYFYRFNKYLDVLSLGKEHAINLGVNYNYVVKRMLIIVAVLTSVSTALVGPITFLGLLVANIAYQFIKTYRHQYIIAGSMLISIVALLGGQLIVERVFTFSTSLSVIINFIGGVYFIYLLLKENKSW